MEEQYKKKPVVSDEIFHFNVGMKAKLTEA